MKSGRRALKICVAAAALGALLGVPGEARAGSEDGILVLVGIGGLGFLGADLAFAGHDLDAAVHSNLRRDDWLTAETIVSVPQALAFNALLFGFNTSDDDEMAIIGTALGTIPTAGVTALTTHGIWGIADKRTDADALAGISVIIGTDFALTMAALGRASARRLHSRGIGVFATVLATPCTAVGIYESTFSRPQQGAWIGLTAWSGALLVHGVVSAIVDGDSVDREVPPAYPGPETPPPDAPGLRKAAKRSFGPATFTMAPTFLSDGVAQMPGIVAAGTF